jgi:hypothetical protein
MRAAVPARVIRVIVSVLFVVMAVPATGQSADQTMPATVVETQANPRGPGAVSFIPPDPATADSTVGPAMPADPNYHAGPYTGALTPPPAAAMGHRYPPCTAKLHDACTNPVVRSGGRHFGKKL